MRLIEEEMGLKRRRIMRIYKGSRVSRVYRISLGNVENYNYQSSYLKQNNYLKIFAWSIFVSLVITRMVLFLFYSEGVPFLFYPEGVTNPFDVFIYYDNLDNRGELFISFFTTFIFALITTAISPFLINSIKWEVRDLFLVGLISTFFFWLLPTLFLIAFFIFLPLTLISLVKWILKNAS